MPFLFLKVAAAMWVEVALVALDREVALAEAEAVAVVVLVEVVVLVVVLGSEVLSGEVGLPPCAAATAMMRKKGRRRRWSILVC